MNTAKLIKETEKALYIEMGCELWGDEVVYFKTWMPKSQLVIEKTENGIVSFETKNNWILGAKVKEYFTYLMDNGYNISESKRNFVAIGKNEDVDRVFYNSLKK